MTHTVVRKQLNMTIVFGVFIWLEYKGRPYARPHIQRYPLLTHQSRGGPTAHTLKINEFSRSFEQIFLRKVELQIL